MTGLSAPTPTTRSPKVGLFLPGAEGMAGGETPPWADLLGMARRAEAVGFDSLWLPDHLLVRLWMPAWDGSLVGGWEC